MKQMQKKSDDAISPVVGVMLMIVVTVIIAAVITGFATGLGDGSATTTPFVVIELGSVNTNANGYLDSVDFIHKGGDTLLWENIEFSLIDTDGYRITNYFPGTYGTVLISGEKGAGTVAEAGDFLRVAIDFDQSAVNGRNAEYAPGNTVEWVMYDKRTDGILASGSFVVP